MERPNGRRRDQLRALLTRSPQENISGADLGNHSDQLASEQEEQEGREERDRRHKEREYNVSTCSIIVNRCFEFYAN